VADWVTWFVFPADAVADEVFACVAVCWPSTGIQIWIHRPRAPEPAGSGAAPSIRTTAFEFVGKVWVEVAIAFASCVVGALWLIDCACPPDELSPVCVWLWSADWFAALPLTA
jgi:hypothetical protein